MTNTLGAHDAPKGNLFGISIWHSHRLLESGPFPKAMIFWKWKTNGTRVLPPLGVTDRQHQGRAANLPVVATMSVCGANERTFPEGRGPANDSCRDSVAAPKTRTSDQIATDQSFRPKLPLPARSAPLVVSCCNGEFLSLYHSDLSRFISAGSEQRLQVYEIILKCGTAPNRGPRQT